MKTKAVVLLFTFASALSAFAGNYLPASRDDVSALYGNGGTRFTWNDITVHIWRDGDAVSRIDYECRFGPFNELQIESMLKDLSPVENWVKTGDGEWKLLSAKCSAHWDGEGHLSVRGD
jgi:hypothetical protein